MYLFYKHVYTHILHLDYRYSVIWVVHLIRSDILDFLFLVFESLLLVYLFEMLLHC